MSIKRSIKRLASAAVAAFGLAALLGAAANVFAQEIVTATVPVTVSVAATVSITPPDDLPGAVGVSAEVPAGTTPTMLTITLADGNTAVSHRAAARGFAPVVINHSRGNVSLRLSPQQYGKATISLFAVNGRRVLKGKADAAKTGLKISRGNVAAGVYLLSVKGTRGNAYSNKIIHSGGRLNIDVAFDASGIAPRLARMTAGDEAEYGEWTITAQADGYNDTSYTFIPVAGVNDPQTIALEPEDCGDDCLCEGFTEGTEREHYGKSKPQFCDKRDGNKYVYQTIGTQTWMAENLNYAAAGSVCYGEGGQVYDNGTQEWLVITDDEVQANHAKYGRLYNWATAMTACPAGWRLPDNAEWDELLQYVDAQNDGSGSGTPYESDNAGKHLKATSGWDGSFEPGNGLDTYGFAALPGGCGNGGCGKGYSEGHYDHAGYNSGYWWSASAYNAEHAYYRNIYYHQEYANWGSHTKNRLYSVRCVKG